MEEFEYQGSKDNQKENWKAIKYIPDPTEQVQLEALRQNLHAIVFIDHPTEKVLFTYPACVFEPNNISKELKEQLILEALKQKGENIMNIYNPTEKQQLIAVRQNWRAIRRIKEPTEQAQLEAINQNPWAIIHIKNPTEQAQLEAVKQNPACYQYIRNKLYPAVTDYLLEIYKTPEITHKTSEKDKEDFFDKLTLDPRFDAKMSRSWFSELIGRLNKLNISLNVCNVTPEKLIGLINNIKNGTISGKIAKDILDEMIVTNKTADEIIKDKNLEQIDNEAIISNVIDEVIKANTKQLEAYKNGNERLFGFFVGQVLKKINNANPKTVTEILKKYLTIKN